MIFRETMGIAVNLIRNQQVSSSILLIVSSKNGGLGGNA
jgi:hypothetical protein